MGRCTYRVSGGTHRGCVRQRNEDAYFLDADKGVFAVADGLGGMPGGDVASQVAVDGVKGHSPGEDIEGCFDGVVEAVREAGKAYGELGIATTLTMGVIEQGVMQVGHVGDSGVMIFGERGWRKITVDHTMAQQMEDAKEPGEQPQIPEFYKHMLTNCIGHAAGTQVLHLEQALAPGMRVLFYTDGVTKVFDGEELRGKAFEIEEPEGYVAWVLEEAVRRGAPDNVTAVMLYVD